MILEVTGIPAPQGSKRGMLNRHTGKVVVVEGGSTTGRERLKTWRQDVIDACRAYMSEHPYDPPLPLQGPLTVVVTYRLPRPRSAPKKRVYPHVKPDVVKIHRATEDAMTLAGIYDDDAQIVHLCASKVYAAGDERPGATIMVRAMGVG